jgi:hypothetical protein
MTTKIKKAKRQEFRYLSFLELPNGNLNIQLTTRGRMELEELLYKQVDNDMIWQELLDDSMSNGSYEGVLPEQIGALTNAPIIGNDSSFVDMDDSGNNYEDCKVWAKIWWFPQYETTDEIELLRSKEGVIFTRAVEHQAENQVIENK